jgi:hypothetical protein
MPRPNPLFLDYTWSIALNISLFSQLRLLDTCQDFGALSASSCSFRALGAFILLMSLICMVERKGSCEGWCPE